MPIYTRAGDSGMTGLYSGKRVSKADCQIETYGSIDELTCFIGLTATKINNKKDKQLLIDIQKDLHKIMGFLSGTKINLLFLENKVSIFEKIIDETEEKLPKLNKFILPGGDEISSWFHILRVICRRVERNMVEFKSNILIIKYLNRLSDLLFIMARNYGKNKEIVL
ncbi:MAG: cob(I)yrinic acid a,c-diamide adenosyltransferase [Patescibacteria group bacterium]